MGVRKGTEELLLRRQLAARSSEITSPLLGAEIRPQQYSTLGQAALGEDVQIADTFLHSAKLPPIAESATKAITPLRQQIAIKIRGFFSPPSSNGL